MENERFLHNDGDEDDNGTAVAIVRVRAVRPFLLADMQAACASYFEDGWLAWELSDVRPVTPCDHPCGTRYLRGGFPTPRQALNIEQDVLGRRLRQTTALGICKQNHSAVTNRPAPGFPNSSAVKGGAQ